MSNKKEPWEGYRETLCGRLWRHTRAQLTEILEEHGFAVYESEDTEMLREAVRVNIMDGTIESV